VGAPFGYRVPGEILLPPAGEYSGFTGSDGGRERRGHAFWWPAASAKALQRIEISGIEVPLRGLLPGVMGDVVGLLFRLRAVPVSWPDGRPWPRGLRRS